MVQYHDSRHTIETERLLLRRFVPADAPQVAAICHTEEVYRGTQALPSLINRRVSCMVAWAWPWISLPGWEKSATGLPPRHWNQGIATEAAKAVIRFGFEVQQPHKINGRFFAYNPASGRVMEKAGMEREGLQKQHVWKIDRLEDIVLYGIVNPNHGHPQGESTNPPLSRSTMKRPCRRIRNFPVSHPCRRVGAPRGSAVSRKAGWGSTRSCK